MYVLCLLSSASELFTVHIIEFMHFAFSVKHKQELVYLNLKFSNNELLLRRSSLNGQYLHALIKINLV